MLRNNQNENNEIKNISNTLIQVYPSKLLHRSKCEHLALKKLVEGAYSSLKRQGSMRG
jgi:hypothetical protein